MYDRVAVKERAKEVVRGHQGTCICAFILYAALSGAAGAASLGLGALLLEPPLLAGLSLFFLHAWRGKRPRVESLFSMFKRYSQSLVGILWMRLFTMLWSFLFVIPGIVKAMAYSMIPYLLADYPDLEPRKALRVSMIITDERKAEIFVMYLSFAGWAILSCLTFGILLFVYAGPYMNTAFAGMYEELLQDAMERGTITEEDLVGEGAKRYGL